MQEVLIKNAALSALASDLASILQQLPEERRALHETLGEAVLRLVRTNLGGSGKAQSWQASHVGTGGGYAAVRPKAGAYTQDKGHYAVGYVTNAIENGHRQSPGRYVPALGRKLVQGRAAGKGFYAAARGEAEQLAYREAERFARTLTERLKGAGNAVTP